MCAKMMSSGAPSKPPCTSEKFWRPRGTPCPALARPRDARVTPLSSAGFVAARSVVTGGKKKDTDPTCNPYIAPGFLLN